MKRRLRNPIGSGSKKCYNNRGEKMKESIHVFTVIEAIGSKTSSGGVDFLVKNYFTSESPYFSVKDYSNHLLTTDISTTLEPKRFSAAEMEGYIGANIIVSHEVEIDIAILDIECEKTPSGKLANTVIGTRKLAELLLPELKQYDLPSVMKSEDLQIQNSYLDNVAVLYAHFIKQAKKKGIDPFLAIYQI